MDPDQSNVVAPHQLARLIEAAQGSGGEWKPDELGGILAHQLSSPVEFELEGFERTPAPELAARLASIHSFQELFQSASPPLELLTMTKDYAKAHLVHPETILTREIAVALYYASIALALVHHKARITQLADSQLHNGFEWCIAQPWMEPGLRIAFERALKQLA
jgi:hypothetical protein